MPVGTRVVLLAVGDQDPARLRFLESLGLKLGIVFDVKAHQPFRGPVTIWLAGERRDEVVIGHELALSLQCSEVEVAVPRVLST